LSWLSNKAEPQDWDDMGEEMNNVLGVVANTNYSHPSMPFGGKTQSYQNLTRQALSLSVDVVFFSPVGWEVGSTEVDGFWFDGVCWQPRRVVIPSVIYDRFFSNKSNRALIKGFRDFLQVRGCKLLTPYELTRLTGNKHKFTQLLVQLDIPCLESYSLKNVSEKKIRALLSLNQMLYLKPIRGTKAKGIVVVEQLASDLFLLHSDAAPTVGLKSRSLSDALRSQAQFKGYIVQPRADALTVGAQPFYIRVLVQNPGDGRYAVVEMLVRLGAAKAWTAIECAEERGLSFEALADYYRQTQSKDISRDRQKIEAFCLKCCRHLHETVGEFAELGFDVMLTHSQGPVLLEANSKPGRSIFRLMVKTAPADSEVRQHYQSLLDGSIRQLAAFALSICPE